MTEADDDRESTTGLPGFRSWPAVYLLVTATFVLWVLLMLTLQRVFS